MSFAPFTPSGALGPRGHIGNGGVVWPLVDGGWAFQYPDVSLRLESNGHIRAMWRNASYAVEYAPDGIVYHAGEVVVRKSSDGDVVYHHPTGTVHQVGNTIIYHWCNPNVIVYNTPSGIIYYDDAGMTYRGAGTAHYSPNGDVVYQGIGGITRQFPNGAVTHWTGSGAIYRHADGTLTYTPIGESKPQVLDPEALGPDPFPGPPLSVEQVLALARDAGAPIGSPAPAPAAAAIVPAPALAVP